MISLRTACYHGSEAVFAAISAALLSGALAADVFVAPSTLPVGRGVRSPVPSVTPVQLAKSRTPNVPKAEEIDSQSVKPAEIPEYADALPSEIRTPAEDLLLQRAGERKAEALTAFAGAITAEDSADSERSLKLYRRVLALDPSYVDLAVQVAFEYTKLNDVPKAIQVLKDSIKAAPTQPQPLVYLSQLYSRYLKKPDLALRYAEQAVAVAPETFSGYLAAYELHVIAENPKKAEAVLERASKSKTTDPKFWLQLGDLFTRLYLKEDGSSNPNDQARMNAVYDKAAELGKDDASIQAKVGDYYVLSRQVKEAIPYYRAALETPKSSDENALLNLRDKLARAFLITEQTDDAIAMLEQTLVENPMRYETYELLGELYEKKGEVEKALGNYEKSLLLDGSRPENYLRVADMYLRQRKIDQAVEAMKAARARFPNVPQITFSLAITLSQAKKHTEAMTAFAVAQADAELSNQELLDSSFYFQYGAAAEQAGLMEKAADMLRESIRLAPNSAAQAYNYLGYMWADRGMNMDEAGEMIRKALELDPDNAAYLDSLGWYYFKVGKPDEALTQLLRAADGMQEGDPVVYDHIGDTYHLLGKNAEAMNYWQKAMALDDASDKIAEKIEAAKQKLTQTQKTTPPIEQLPAAQ
ncbi:MAG: tetratricopeptide repeat protein [Chthoniobacteraceae bacterium]